MTQNSDRQDEDKAKPATGDKPPRRVNIVYVFLFMFVGLFLMNYRAPLDTVKCTPEVIERNPDVVMLGAWWCGYCYKAKRYFHDNNVDYCEYDMENNPVGIELYEQSGGGVIPVMMIGEYTLRGYSERQIESALALLQQDKSGNTENQN